MFNRKALALATQESMKPVFQNEIQRMVASLMADREAWEVTVYNTNDNPSLKHKESGITVYTRVGNLYIDVPNVTTYRYNDDKVRTAFTQLMLAITEIIALQYISQFVKE